MGHADANDAGVAVWEAGYVARTERERNFKEAYGNAKTAMKFGLDCVSALQSARDICSAGGVDKIPTADALFVFIMTRLAHMKIKDTIRECFPSSLLFDLPADCGEAFGVHFMSLVHAELPRHKLRECAELLGVSDRLYAMIGTLTQTECVVVLECFRYWVSDASYSVTVAEVAERVAVAERIVAERIAAERVVAERIAAERIAAERIAAERIVAERIAAERIAAERDDAERDDECEPSCLKRAKTFGDE